VRFGTSSWRWQICNLLNDACNSRKVFAGNIDCTVGISRGLGSLPMPCHRDTKVVFPHFGDRMSPVYDTVHDKWIGLLPPVPSPTYPSPSARVSTAVVKDQDTLFACEWSNTDNQEPLKCWSLSVTAAMSPLQTKSTGGGQVVIRARPQKSGEKQWKQWKRCASPTSIRFHVKVRAVSDHLVIGIGQRECLPESDGFPAQDHAAIHPILELYDAITDEWKLLPPIKLDSPLFFTSVAFE
jgi:hypothetical protein